MAIQNAKAFRALKDLIRAVTNCELQMRNAAKTYRANRVQYNAAVTAGAPQATLDQLNAEAKFALQHGVTRPSFVQSRINQFIAMATTLYGTQAAAVAAIDAAISAITNGTCTHTDFTTEINNLLTIQTAIVNGVTNSAWTGDQVATYLEQNVPDHNDFYAQPTEAAYVEPTLNITTI